MNHLHMQLFRSDQIRCCSCMGATWITAAALSWHDWGQAGALPPYHLTAACLQTQCPTPAILKPGVRAQQLAVEQWLPRRTPANSYIWLLAVPTSTSPWVDMCPKYSLTHQTIELAVNQSHWQHSVSNQNWLHQSLIEKPTPTLLGHLCSFGS